MPKIIILLVPKIIIWTLSKILIFYQRSIITKQPPTLHARSKPCFLHLSEVGVSRDVPIKEKFLAGFEPAKYQTIWSQKHKISFWQSHVSRNVTTKKKREQRRTKPEPKKLEKQKDFLKEEIAKDKEILEKMSDKNELEKLAREKYYMKRDNEDIYIIEFEDEKKAAAEKTNSNN